MIATAVNGQPAIAAYLHDNDEVYRAWGLGVFDMTSEGIARVVVFGDPHLIALCGLAPVLYIYQGSK